MRKLIPALLIAALAGSASAREFARPTHGGIPVASPRGEAVATAPNAPNAGVITRLDLQARQIGISGRDMTVSQQTVAILDRRPNGNGANKVSDLRVGMQVRYRLADGAGSLPQVAELWMLSDAPSAPIKSTQRK